MSSIVARSLRPTLALSLCFALWGCGDDSGGPADAATDSGAGDSGVVADGGDSDSGSADAGSDAGPDDAGGDPDAGGDSGPADGGAPDVGADGANCDRSTVTCRRVEPDCADGTVPEVEGSCWTDRCLAIDLCGCTLPEHCPMPEIYTCHRSAGRCGPYL